MRRLPPRVGQRPFRWNGATQHRGNGNPFQRVPIAVCVMSYTPASPRDLLTCFGFLATLHFVLRDTVDHLPILILANAEPRVANVGAINNI